MRRGGAIKRIAHITLVTLNVVSIICLVLFRGELFMIALGVFVLTFGALFVRYEVNAKNVSQEYRLSTELVKVMKHIPYDSLVVFLGALSIVMILLVISLPFGLFFLS